jgi:prevent-host-death family protein
METIAVSQLRAQLLRVIQQVEGGQTVTVTSRGRPVALLVPPVSPAVAARQALARLRRTAVVGDVLSPTGETWHGEQ